MTVQTSRHAQEMLAALEERKRLRQEGDVRALMATPGGRRWMFRLLDGRCGVLGLSFCGELPLTAAFNDGRRSVGVDLVQEIQQLCPAEWDLMWSEQRALQDEDRRWRKEAEERSAAER